MGELCKEKCYEQIEISKECQGDDLYTSLMNVLKVLLKEENVCKVYQEEEDVIIIQFEHDNSERDWGGPDLEWITEEDRDIILASREV